MIRLLITGGSSFLGQHLTPLAAARYETAYTYFSANPLNLPHAYQLDLRDPQAVRRLALAWQPQVILHLAGSNRSPDMERVIVAGAQHVAAAAQTLGARLVAVSTDVLFDGADAPYRETDDPAPVHPYAQAKYVAEGYIRQVADHVVVRPSLLYSRRLVDPSTRWTTEALQQGQPVTLFTNQWRNPVAADTLAQALLELVEHSYRGLLHVAGRQAVTRAVFGLRLLDYWGFTRRDTLSLGPDLSGRYPLDCRLDLTLAHRQLRTPLLGLDDVMPPDARRA